MFKYIGFEIVAFLTNQPIDGFIENQVQNLELINNLKLQLDWISTKIWNGWQVKYLLLSNKT